MGFFGDLYSKARMKIRNFLSFINGEQTLLQEGSDTMPVIGGESVEGNHVETQGSVIPPTIDGITTGTNLRIEYGVVAPKQEGQGDRSDFFDQIKVPESASSESVISFERLDLPTIRRIRNCDPIISGKLNGQPFIVEKDIAMSSKYKHEATIYVEGGNKYRFRVRKDTGEIGYFQEELVLDSGTTETFKRTTQSVSRTITQKDKRHYITLTECGKQIPPYHDSVNEFNSVAQYAQPSDDVLTEYAEATGLPILKKKEKISVNDYMTTDSEEEEPFLVTKEATFEGMTENNVATILKKHISYVYTSEEAFKSGERPYMIHMEGIDGREGFSGMFRLQGDSYVDNSTFRREDGEYRFDTVTYEQIMELAGPMAQLTDKMNLAMNGSYETPNIIRTVGSKMLEMEKGKKM